MRAALVSLLFVVTWPLAAQQWDTIPRLPDHYKKRVALFEKEKVKEGSDVFLGNSITEGGDWKKLMNDSTAVNRGIGGDITFGLLQRLHQVVKIKPARLFLLIGINDLSKGIPEDVVLENIFLLVMEIKKQSPATQIFVQSILPVNPSFKNFPKGYNLQEAVNTVNTQLSKIEARFGYTYVDLYNQFTDANGLLRSELSTDGLHLNAAGYAHWVRVLKEKEIL